MSDTVENTNTSPTSLPVPSDDYKRPLFPYVLDFIKYISGFVGIIIIALIIIHVVSAKFT